jgi:hypothetical protein
MNNPVGCYLRVGKGVNGFKVSASMKPNPEALREVRAGSEHAIPTVQMKLKLDFSTSAFHAAEKLITIDDSAVTALSCTNVDVDDGELAP